MTSSDIVTRNLVNEMRADLAEEHAKAAWRAKSGIIVRVVLILIVASYMTWITRAVSVMDAPALTRIAATSIEERLPELRSELSDYAIAVAPELTDQGLDLLLELPVQLREHLETRLLAKTELLIARFEVDVDAAITAVVDDQIELVQAQLPGAGPEEQLDAIVLGISDLFRDTMTEALDELYYDYTEEVRRLNADLEHLLRDEDLTESEQIDKQLIGAWMVLAHKYQLTDPGALIAGR